MTVTANDVLKELKSLGTEAYAEMMRRHLSVDPIYGVKVEDMKKIQKRIKKDYQLALDLYDSGVYDAMYLAGLIADDEAMTKKDLEKWVTTAKSPGISEYTVPWVASEGRYGMELGLKWIDSKKETIASSGWQTLACLVAIKEDADLDVKALGALLDRVAKTIHDQPNRVKYTMNGFVIAVGGYVEPLTKKATEVAKKIGTVSVDMHGTACKVPFAPEYILKMHKRGTLGRKRKTAKC
ncbi:MAG: DNA alkylation repair protein [Blastocatellia bacterium]|jgi:3-methyladenine DNA glycosylase AlkD